MQPSRRAGEQGAILRLAPRLDETGQLGVEVVQLAADRCRDLLRLGFRTHHEARPDGRRLQRREKHRGHRALRQIHEAAVLHDARHRDACAVAQLVLALQCLLHASEQPARKP